MQLTAVLPFPLTVVAGMAATLLIYFLILLARNEAVFIPLPQATIDSMLRMADIKHNDVLFDLGSGDGRIVIAAARQYGIRAVGIEKSRVLAWLSKRAIRKNNVEDKVEIVNADFFHQDLSDATIVTAYLSRRINHKLETKLRRELKEGTKILSADHTFSFPEKAKHRTGHFWTHLYIR
jgi:ubiquinone/menaquinone biosynthesis C-methylase UbiE